MEPNGALSNPLAGDKYLHLAILAAATGDMSIGEWAPDRLLERLLRRQGSALAAVMSILGTAAEPKG
jgi:hypothetical protein